ncbi:MAG: head GIN domain-containing protein [Acidobacteriota bacterium]
MKKIGIIVFAIAILIGVAFSSLFSFGRLTGRVLNLTFNHGVQGSGNISTETRDARDFKSVEVGGIFQVEIVAQKDFSVQVEADDNLLQYIKTEVDGDVLKIESDERIKSNSPIRIRISAPNIERVEATGASKVTVADLKNESIDLDTSGASKISLAGETMKLTIGVSGASKIDAENLKAESANVDASGASHVAVNATETLRSEASGASRITYTGNPKNVQKDVSGASSINQK